MSDEKYKQRVFVKRYGGHFAKYLKMHRNYQKNKKIKMTADSAFHICLRIA